jgi:hypothetical protein
MEGNISGQASQPQSPHGAHRPAHSAARDKRRRRVIIALLSTLGALTLSCALAIVYLIIPNPRQRLLPEGAGLPPLEIVFHAEDADIGFIHPDGSGYVTRDLQISEGFWRGRLKSPSLGRTPARSWAPPQALALAFG